MVESLTVAYRILKALETKEDKSPASLLSPELQKCSPSKWEEVLKMLMEEEYIRGVVVGTDITGEKFVDIREARITFKGAEYLSENSVMKKIEKAVSGVVSIVK